jgi:hypothetical protein
MNRPAGVLHVPDPVCRAAVERYLADVAARLPGRPAKVRADILAELRSGLLDACDVRRSAGLQPADAVAAAVREFGDAGQVAGAFLPEIAAGSARRSAAVLLVTGPLVGALWIVTAVASRLSAPSDGLGAGLLLLAAAVVVTVCAGTAGIAATGRLSRWLPAAPRGAPLAGAITGFGAVAADGLGLVFLAAELAAGHGNIALLPASAAAAASLARLLVASRSARRCLAMRARLARL